MNQLKHDKLLTSELHQIRTLLSVIAIVALLLFVPLYALAQGEVTEGEGDVAVEEGITQPVDKGVTPTEDEGSTEEPVSPEEEPGGEVSPEEPNTEEEGSEEETSAVEPGPEEDLPEGEGSEEETPPVEPDPKEEDPEEPEDLLPEFSISVPFKKVEIPFGLSIDEFINSLEIYEYADKDLDELTLEEFKSTYIKDGVDPIVVTYEPNVYPADNGKLKNVQLSWAPFVDTYEGTPPNLDDIRLEFYGSINSYLPLEATRNIKIVNAEHEELPLIVDSYTDSIKRGFAEQIWLNEELLTSPITFTNTDPDVENPLHFSFGNKISWKGDLIPEAGQPADTTSTVLTYQEGDTFPQRLYVKLDRDYYLNSKLVRHKGRVVSIPVQLDRTAPQITEFKTEKRDYRGSKTTKDPSSDPEAQPTSTTRVSEDGVRFEVRATDEKDSNVPLIAGEQISGLETLVVTLVDDQGKEYVEQYAVPWTQSRSFKVTSENFGNYARYDLDKSHVQVIDHAGNVSETHKLIDIDYLKNDLAPGHNVAYLEIIKSLPQFELDLRQNQIVIPYGVDIAAYINSLEMYKFKRGGYGELSLETFKKEYIKGNVDPIVVKFPDDTYPENDEELDELELAWAPIKDQYVREVPDLSKVKLKFAYADIRFVPTDAFNKISFTAPSGEERSFYTTPEDLISGEDVQSVWFNKAAIDESVKVLGADDEAESPLFFSLGKNLTNEGVFVPVEGDAPDSRSVVYSYSAGAAGDSEATPPVPAIPADSFPQLLYVKLDQDYQLSSGDEYVKGQIVKLNFDVDATAPFVSEFELKDTNLNQAVIEHDEEQGQTKLLADSDGFKFDFSLTDIPSDEVEILAGEKISELRKARLTLVTTTGTEHVLDFPVDGPTYNGSIEINASNFAGYATYELSQSTLVATDYAGNELVFSLSDIAQFKEHNPEQPITQLEIVDVMSDDWQVDAELLIDGKPWPLEVSDNEGDEGEEETPDTPEKQTYITTAESVEITARIKDRLFKANSSSESWLESNPILFTQDTDVEPISLNPLAFTAGSEPYSYLSEPQEISEEGRYYLELGYTIPQWDLIGRDKVNFEDEGTLIIDRTSPQFFNMRLSQPFDEDRELAQLPDKNSYLIGGPRTLEFDVADLFAGAGLDSLGTLTAAEASGLKSLSATVNRTESLHSEELIEEVIFQDIDWTSKYDSVPVTLELGEPGMYKLSDITITATDIAGNVTEKTIAQIIADAPDEVRERFPFEAIIVSNPLEEEAELTLETEDIEDAPLPSIDDYYLRADQLITVTVQDPWFEVRRHLGANSPFIKAFLKNPRNVEEGMPGLEGETHKLDIMSELEFSYDAEKDAWVATYNLPRIELEEDQTPPEDPMELPAKEGIYTFAINYVRDQVEVEEEADSSDLHQLLTFEYDRTAPAFGDLVISKTKPVEWGWLFARDTVTFSAPVIDALTGVEEDEVRLMVNGKEGVLEPVFENDTMSFTVAGDSRYAFEHLSFKLTDRAGNAAVVKGLNNLPNAPQLEDMMGVSIDTAAPVISVSFSGPEPLNGIYYPGHRKAVVTVTDYNFDLVKINDKSRAIITLTHDGHTSKIPAGEFKNPSGDGITWVYTVDFEADGEWAIDVAFTDPSGKTAQPFHDEFVIDTIPPLYTVEWHNTDRHNGFYFNKPQSATITVRDRSFSPDLVNISATGKQIRGAVVSNPGISGWRQTEKDTYQTTISFPAELDYEFSLNLSDLAGNTTEGMEDRFIVDMTPPVIDISRIANQVAYAGFVAPYIEFSDINHNAAQTRVVISRLGSDKPVYLSVERNDSITKSIYDYQNFPKEVEYDDVYVMTVTTVDLAGNEVTQSLMFSVNRFGSTYIFADSTNDARGAFLNESQDIEITEINVSGLELEEGIVELAYNSKIKTLVPKDDYSVTNLQRSSGWHETTYRIPASNFDADGYYRVNVTSHDNAGNLSQNTMMNKKSNRDNNAYIEFALDTTAPQVELINATDDMVEFGPGITVVPRATDNLQLQRVEFLINDKVVDTWEASSSKETLSTKTLQHAVSAQESKQDFEIRAIDRAGNANSLVVNNALITQNWLIYIRNSPELLYPLVAAAIVIPVISGIVIALVARRRRRRAARKNPFARSANVAQSAGRGF